jgi:hypothetical protein
MWSRRNGASALVTRTVDFGDEIRALHRALEDLEATRADTVPGVNRSGKRAPRSQELIAHD